MAALVRAARQRPAACAAAGSLGFAFSWQAVRGAQTTTTGPLPSQSQLSGSLVGRRAIVVGGTSGIGHGIALSLAKAGCSVTVVGRSEVRGRGVVDELVATAARSAGGAKKESLVGPGPDFAFESLDCLSLPACSEFASKHSAGNSRPLDFLVLTQGMASLQGLTCTPQACGGLDEKLTLHYWSRVTLAKKLAPLLDQSTDGRVLSVLSAGEHRPYANYGEDPELRRGYSLKAAADSAGFYNDIAVEQMSLEHPKVSFLHACPGFVATNWGTEMPAPVRFVVRALQLFGRSKEDCGDLMCKGLTSEKYKGGGWHLLDQYGEATPKVTALHDTAKSEVWAHTKRVINRLGSVEA